MRLPIKENQLLIQSFHKDKKYHENYYLEKAKRVYRPVQPSKEAMNDFENYSNLNWYWFFTYVLNQEVHPKKVPLWEQAMYPWKKY